MPQSFTRRQFLKSAGGITFLALVPVGKGLFADPVAGSTLPVFTALPYVQAGGASALVEGSESIVLAWQTMNTPASFRVEFGKSSKLGLEATVVSNSRPSGDGAGRLNYSAKLTGLSLSGAYHYRVTSSGKKVVEGYFATRRRRGEPIRFVSFGDNAHGDPGEIAVAYWSYQSHPDFIMNTGDNVYESGLDEEYARFFFPIYNADKASATTGAPLLRSVPFYTVMANHDVTDKHAPDGKSPAADFDNKPGSLAYYTNMYLPLNGPATPPNPTPAFGPDAVMDSFKHCAGERFPRMGNYSFDYGDAHFLCLDSNNYVDPTNSDLQAWATSDLKQTDAIWKFVVHHHPAYNVGREHWQEQHMRALSPLFEEQGVDMVFSGHEHVYQRTLPFKFSPSDLTGAKDVGSGRRVTPGTFTVDKAFDGASNTTANGVIYITTGAGGKELYDPGFDTDPSLWSLDADKNIAYTAMFHSAKHSFTLIDIVDKKLTLTQIDESGKEVDRMVLTKA